MNTTIKNVPSQLSRLILIALLFSASMVIIHPLAAHADDCGHDVWAKGTMISGGFTEAENRQETLFWSNGDPGNCWGNSVWGLDPDPNQSDSYCYSNDFVDFTKTNGGGYSIDENGPDAVRLSSSCDFSWMDTAGSMSSTGSFNIYANISAGWGGWAGACSYDGFIPDGADLNCDAGGY